ncbi:hypothetical protein CRUP_018267 [Coryphaenoides rupestris]|nr:hypothetical protein CRUP_018267 [Coryphaenoides rupestris]
MAAETETMLCPFTSRKNAWALRVLLDHSMPPGTASSRASQKSVDYSVEIQPFKKPVFAQTCLMWKLTTYSVLVRWTEMAKGSNGWKVKATSRRTAWLTGRPRRPAWILNFSSPESRLRADGQLAQQPPHRLRVPAVLGVHDGVLEPGEEVEEEEEESSLCGKLLDEAEQGNWTAWLWSVALRNRSQKFSKSSSSWSRGVLEHRQHLADARQIKVARETDVLEVRGDFFFER